MEVNDRRARLATARGLIGDLARRDGEVRGLRARDLRADDGGREDEVRERARVVMAPRNGAGPGGAPGKYELLRPALQLPGRDARAGRAADDDRLREDVGRARRRPGARSCAMTFRASKRIERLVGRSV